MVELSVIDEMWAVTRMTIDETAIAARHQSVSPLLDERARRNNGTYPKGMKVGDAEMEALYLDRDAVHGGWNYTLIPRERLPLPEAVVS